MVDSPGCQTERMDLSVAEQRVLGSLVEKQMTTPDTYPLTTNALVAAANQSSNREPVLDLTEDEVLEAIATLREEGFARSVKRPEDRVMKHRHDLPKALELDDRAVSVLAVLLLRGAQTPGELRLRTDRYVSFATPADVERVLEGLAERDEPLTRELERRPGQKEQRWIHLLGPVPQPTFTDTPDSTPTRASRLDQLEERVSELEAVVTELRDQLRELIGD